ncbi:Spherulation-specific family 4-domain-containing protein [Mycena alexandri]|uniref:Spherulation-specific family 4-domain-containing protein n=1 Tax=Mycena alexandri TaxID=1745969 RepID=A0AAD6SLK5_9AGAR|nr:Spherulation-specific family 4-domain-containing protein [Mycena alexandri]
MQRGSHSRWQDTFPELQFYVIVNPESGPGATDPNYQAAVAAFHAYANVLIVGYVLTSYGARPLDQVQQDIETYAGSPAAWPRRHLFLMRLKQVLRILTPRTPTRHVI